MADHSKIEWTDASWNLIRARDVATGKVGWHCTQVSEGCRHCYAEGINRRLGTGHDYKPAVTRGQVEVLLDDKMLLQPLRWKKPRKIFVGSMTDLFADFVSDDMLDRIFAVAALAQQHTLQIVTKRPARMRDYLTARRTNDAVGAAMAEISDEADRLGIKHDYPCWAFTRGEIQMPPLRNTWLMVSAEDQATADARIPILLDTPAAVRGVSAEPLLGPLDFNSTLGGTLWMGGQRGCGGMHRGNGSPDCPLEPHHHHDERCRNGLDLVIVGGESGPNARPMHPDWARAIRDQCAAAGVAFFFKQWGEWEPHPSHRPLILEACASGPPDVAWPDGTIAHGCAEEHEGAGRMLRRVGKKAAGRLLDGREYNELPGLPS